MGADRESNPKLAGNACDAPPESARPSDDPESGLLATVDAPRSNAVPVRLDSGTAVDGRYRIERVLGAGGMGAVYVAMDLQLERLVALKMIRSDMAANRRVAERFRREAVAVARLRHPHIVTVHDYGVASDVGAYIVMELLEGHSLRLELMRRAPLDPSMALDLTRQVCQAVGAAHRAGVIHLDLKPENIVLESHGRSVAIKVVDFGLAKLEAVFRSDGDSLTIGEATFGTPAYMSPEQCSGEGADARSDVYSLGCVLFELLTGRPPFVGRPAMTLLYKHVNELPPRPSDLVPTVLPGLDGIVARALAKNPDRRFQSMEAFEQALDSLGATAVATTLDVDGATREIELMTTVGGGWLETEPPNNLPHATSRFFGRTTQIDDVQGRLAEARLVTLVGPGGIGKTRLSLEVAGRARVDYAGGVWFVELAALADPSLVAPTVASVVGAREQPGQSADEAIAAWLRQRRVLLVLDNCEHLVDACARLADDLLRACPALRILATSREPLGVSGEVAFPVPALTVPDAGTQVSAELIDGFEATRMFVERAALGRPGFAPAARNAEGIAEVCRRLEGIPLAIELAAACTTTLSVAQIAAKLDDRFRLLTRGNRTAPRRQQTLRAAIDWSHDLLSEVERTLLRRLSVFAGGFTYDAAEDVAALDALDPLKRLVDTSFLLAEEKGDGSLRYRLFETLREYAEERLVAAGEAERTLDRHRKWYLGIVEAAEPHLTGPGQAEWVARLADEHDNIRAALKRSIEAGDGETGLRFCYTLGRFWSVRACIEEGRGWLDRVLSATTTPMHPLRPRVLLWASQLSRLEGDMVHARARIDESQQIASGLGATMDIAAALLERSTIEFGSFNLDEAVVYANEALRVCESTGDRRGIGLALTSLGNVSCERGDYDQGSELFERALIVHRGLGDLRGMASILSNLGRLVAMRGEFERSRELLAEGLTCSSELGDQTVVAFCHNSLGLVATQAGDYDDAMRRFAAALSLFRRLNVLNHIAEVLESVATVAVRSGNARGAAVLIGAAGEIRESAGIPLSTLDRAEVDEDLDAARRAIGDEHVELALAEGRAMSLDDAIAFSMSPPPASADDSESER